jgi:hypothetical protein
VIVKLKNHNSTDLYQIILFGLIFLGVVIVFSNQILNRSLWLDEAMLALNVQSKTYSELLNPLDWHQVAPIGFLMVQKTVTSIFDYHDWSFRLVSVFSWLMGIFVFWAASTRVFQSPLLALICAGALALNPYSIGFATEFKQYSTDLLFSTLIILSFYNLQRVNGSAQKVVFVLVGVFSVWLSNVAIVPLTTVSLILIVQNRFSIRFKLVYGVLFGASFLTYYFSFISGNPLTDFMKDFWAGAFIPLTEGAGAVVNFMRTRTMEVFSNLLCYGPLYPLMLLLYLIGVLAFVTSKNWVNLFLVLMPLAIHLVLSALKMYPFAPRFMLYTIPFFLIPIVNGLRVLLALLPVDLKGLKNIGFFIPVVVLLYPLYRTTPIEKEELKQGFAFLEKEGIDDPIYVPYRTLPAFEFYLNQYPNVASQPYRSGNSLEVKWTDYLNNLPSDWNQFWFVYTKLAKPDGSMPEYDRIKSELANYGLVLQGEFRFTGGGLIKLKREDIE